MTNKSEIVSLFSTKDLILRLYTYLSERRKTQILITFILMLLSGFAEVISLAAIAPFLSVITNTDILLENPFFKRFNSFLNPDNLLILITIVFTSTVILAAIIRILNIKINGLLAAKIGSDLSCEAFNTNLYQDYSVHISRNSSKVITSISQHTTSTVLALDGLLMVLTSLVVSIFILVGLLIISWQIATFSAIVFGLTYWFIAFNVRSRLQTNSYLGAQLASKQIKLLQEGLGSVRDVILSDSQSVFTSDYHRVDSRMRNLKATNMFLRVFPRYSLEAIGIVIIAFFALISILRGINPNTIIPLLGSIALGSQKLIPLIQQIYAGWAKICNYSADIDSVLEMLDQKVNYNKDKGFDKDFIFERSIDFSNIDFKYPNQSINVINKLNLHISKGERIGLIGETGSGKSTLVDIMLGLLKPTNGILYIDEIDINNPINRQKLIAWRRQISHVPQDIYLLDASIAENIAFGMPKEKIIYKRVIEAAQKAQIHSFINQCSEGYETHVGERGVRLSGGQLQRIAIARALYKRSNIIFLDEATSAVDIETESGLMDAIEGLGRDITIIMIAHRLSTLKRFDRVIRLNKQGLIEADGSPSVILSN